MIIIASANGTVGMQQAMQVLKGGGSALDAVEVGIRAVEANPEDHSVGYGGYPNILGEVELDAALMVGDTLMSGAVGSMRGYKYPISVARQVMESLPHVFLVGQGAERFAAEIGAEAADLLTDPARQIWQRRIEADLPAEVGANLAARPDLRRWVKIATDPERPWGTVNFIARDSRGTICAGVSTSGWAWKYPGRLGDSPVVGAGLYADNRYGAAACTGMGEMAIRASTAHSIVFYLKMGLSLAEAGQRAMTDLQDLGGPYLSRMNFIALDHQGRHDGFSNQEGQSYIAMQPDMAEPEVLPRTYVPMALRWE
jgi:beta-aspartyl-peptidase (threonine type)